VDFDPGKLTDETRSKLFLGLVVPRPIAVVSTVSREGYLNVAPFSYFNVVSDSPMAIGFSMTGPKPDKTDKDTLRNVRRPTQGGVGEFVVNVASENYATAIAAAGASLPYGASEFEYGGITPAPSICVKPPRVAEAYACFECRTRRIIRIGHAHLVIGSVVHVWVRDELLDERLRVDPDKLRAIGRMAGFEYCRTADRFEMVTGARPAENRARLAALGARVREPSAEAMIASDRSR
jgi:flavin reductase (DIM6/NTAB) family NADH-FMN oxidoreductase RutF